MLPAGVGERMTDLEEGATEVGCGASGLEEPDLACWVLFLAFCRNGLLDGNRGRGGVAVGIGEEGGWVEDDGTGDFVTGRGTVGIVVVDPGVGIGVSLRVWVWLRENLL